MDSHRAALHAVYTSARTCLPDLRDPTGFIGLACHRRRWLRIRTPFIAFQVQLRLILHPTLFHRAQRSPSIEDRSETVV